MSENQSINIEILSGNKKFIFIANDIKKEDISVFKSNSIIKFPKNNITNNSSKNEEYSDENKDYLYVIMFNRVINIY